MVIQFLVLAIVFAACASLFEAWFLSPKQKGKRGEKRVNKILNECDGKVLSDLYLLDENQKSHQIDHILINKCGVFVIETKNYHGRIYGNDENKNWTQVLKYGKVKNQFYSPVKQNATHCYMIKNLIKDTHIKVFNVVVLAQNNSKFVKSGYTIDAKELKNEVMTVHPSVLSEAQISSAYTLINSHRSLTTNKEHVKNIKETQNEIKHNICPRCGGKLILKHGKYGDFYGCENYPKCRFTKKI